MRLTSVNSSQSAFLKLRAKSFFSVIDTKNKYIDTSLEKAGIPKFSGCLEHTSMIWHQIQAAKVGVKKRERDLHVIFLDYHESQKSTNAQK